MKLKSKILAALFLIAVLIAVVFTSPVEAQTLVYTNNTSMTNTLANNTTTTANLGNAIDLQYHRDCGLMLKFQGDGSGTGLVTLTFGRSQDGTTATLETTPTFTWSVPQNGTTLVVGYTNLSESVIGASRYIHLLSAANTNATVSMTNVSLVVVTKSKP